MNRKFLEERVNALIEEQFSLERQIREEADKLEDAAAHLEALRSHLEASRSKMSFLNDLRMYLEKVLHG